MREKTPFIHAVSWSGEGVLTGLLLVCALTFLAMTPALRGQLPVWDDGVHLTDNTLVRSLDADNIRYIFHSQINKTYIPLTILSFAVEYQLVKYHPFLYHLNNLLLHLAVTGLIYYLALRLGLGWRPAFFGALLFGLHPMHVESVAWVTERKDVLYAVFYLLSIHCYLSYVRDKNDLALVAAVAGGVASMLAKPMAVSLPLILLLVDWFLGRIRDRRVWVEKLPFFLFMVPLAWMTLAANDSQPLTNLGQSALIWVWTLMFYLRQFFFPLRLLPVYDLPQPVTLWSAPYGLAVVGLALALAGIVVLVWARRRWAVFAAGYFFLSIFILLRTHVDTAGVNPVADRFMYLPSLGFCLLIGILFDRVIRRVQPAAGWRRVLVYAGVAVVFLSFGTRTFLQSRIWYDNTTMWGYLAREAPDNSRAQFALGQEAYKKGQWQEAMDHYLEAVRLNPQYAKAHNNIGDLLYAIGLKPDAMEHFRLAVQYNPDYADAHNNYAALLLDQGQIGLARRHIEEALRVDPLNPVFKTSMGDVLWREGDLSAAQAWYADVLLLDPKNAQVLNRMGAVAMQEGRLDDAIRYFQDAVQADPNRASTRHNLQKSLARQQSQSLRGNRPGSGFVPLSSPF